MFVFSRYSSLFLVLFLASVLCQNDSTETPKEEEADTTVSKEDEGNSSVEAQTLQPKVSEKTPATPKKLADNTEKKTPEEKVPDEKSDQEDESPASEKKAPSSSSTSSTTTTTTPEPTKEPKQDTTTPHKGSGSSIFASTVLTCLSLSAMLV